jgi:hypothetical protein
VVEVVGVGRVVDVVVVLAVVTELDAGGEAVLFDEQPARVSAVSADTIPSTATDRTRSPVGRRLKS